MTIKELCNNFYFKDSQGKEQNDPCDTPKLLRRSGIKISIG